MGSVCLQIAAIELKVIPSAILTCFEVCNELLIHRVLLKVLLLVLDQLGDLVEELILGEDRLLL